MRVHTRLLTLQNSVLFKMLFKQTISVCVCVTGGDPAAFNRPRAQRSSRLLPELYP